jgi:cell division protein FtsW
MEASIYRMRLRDLLAVCVFSLLALGVLMVQSAAQHLSGRLAWDFSTPRSGQVVQPEGKATLSPAALARKQQMPVEQKNMIYAALAVAAFLAVGNLNYKHLGRKNIKVWQSPAVWALAIAGITCVLVLVPGIGKEVNGARRWINLGPIQVQPSELAKWGTVLFLAWWLSRRPVDVRKFFTGFIPTLIPVGFVCLLIVIQDFGTAALIGACALTMLLAGRVKLWHLAIIIPPALAAAFWFVAHEEYRWRRMTAFLNPYANPQGEGYHMIQSLLSFSTGGLFGRGLGNGIQKLGYLPEDTTDFIFAVICEELGIFGALLTAALYLGIAFVAWQVIRQRRDSFGRMLAFGVASMICLQAVINMAVATVSVPTKGLSLPLVSAGGSGLIITCAALGLLYSVTRFGHDAEDDAVDAPLKLPEQPTSGELLAAA